MIFMGEKLAKEEAGNVKVGLEGEGLVYYRCCN